MQKDSVKIYVIVCAVVVAFMILSVGSLIYMNIDKGTELFNKDLETIQMGMKPATFSEIILLKEDFVVQNPEGEADGIKMHASLNAKDWQKRQNAGITNENIIDVMKRSENKYAYSILSSDLKQLYAELYLIISGRMENIPICSIDESYIQYVSECVYLDCPELYFYDGYKFVRTILKDKVIKIEYNPIYSMNYSEIFDMNDRINEYTINCLAGISTNMDDYHKVKYVYEYLILNTEYDKTAQYNQTICSVVTSNRTLCLGYARAFQYLLQELEIQSFIVMGSNKSGVSHAWNVVRLGSAYYHFDVTWGDASYPEFFDEGAEINYHYFGVTTDEILRTHIIESVIPIPRCIVIIDNFYVREGLYLTAVNSQKLAEIFNETNRDYSFITIKCSNSTVYEDVGRHLIEENRIRDYLINNFEDIKYADNEVLYTYTFFL